MPASTTSALLVPPLIKSLGQPLRGVAMLKGAGVDAGHTVRVIDLNHRWLRRGLAGVDVPPRSQFLGDHDRDSELVRPLQAQLLDFYLHAADPGGMSGLTRDDVLHMQLDHATALRAAERLLQTSYGRWLSEQVCGLPEKPEVVGISVFFAGQVLSALALTLLTRRIHPQARLVWGGPHVTALQPEIAADARYALAGIDAFVFGYAEQTWVDILGAVAEERALPPEAVRAGLGQEPRAKSNPVVIPLFEGLQDYRWGRLAIPSQSSRGCAYAKCAQCTYPWVEGRYRTIAEKAVVIDFQTAIEHGAVVAFKDALMTPRRLEAIARLSAGNVEWSACTKLHRRLDAPFLQNLADGGCRTLEVGLETLTDAGQLLLDKKQSLDLLVALLDGAEVAGIAVVVNYMLGLPGVSSAEERAGLGQLQDLLTARPELAAKIELNTLQVERRSPLGMHPMAHGIRVVQRWPWSSVVDWRIAGDVAAR